MDKLVFSEDGNHVLVLQESGALQVLEVGTSVKTLLEESVLDISKTMSKGNIVWSDMNTVEPVTFCSSYLALLVNHRWLVQLKWVGCQHMLVLNTIERMCVGVAICRKTAYFLTSLGDVQGYSLEDGGLVGNVLQPGKFGVTDPSILTVSDDGTLVGIADKSGNVYLGQFSAHHEVVRGEDEKSVISTSSASSHISSRTTYSSLLRPQGDSASVHSAEQPKRAILSANIGWNSYLTSLGKWRKRSSATRLPQMALVDSAPKGMQVVSLRLVTAGLAVYYTGSSSVYRLFNVTTAQRVVEFLVPSNCVLVAGLPDLDIFLCPDRLWLHLSGLSRELVLAKLIQCLETPSIGQLLIGDELMVPTATLADGLRHHHMDDREIEVRISVGGTGGGFSLVVFYSRFTQMKAFSKKPSDYDDDTSYKARLSASVTDMERLFDTIYATVRDDTTFSEQLILLCLQHTTNILLNIPSCSSLTKRVMRHITQLREHLYQPNNTLQQSQTYHPLTGLSQKCKECLSCWQDLEDRDVLYNAATTNNIPLSQVYLVTDRGWPKVDFSSRFQQELKHWLHCLLAQGEIHHAKEILVNLGMDPAVELHHLFMKSLVPIARDCAAADLLVGGLLLPKEIEAWRFIQTLEEISLLSSQHRGAMPLSPSSNPLKDVSPSSPGNEPISDECSQVCVYTVIRESEHWRDLVMAALYFNTLAPKLKDLVKPEAACICLLRHGRIDFLIGQASLLGFWPLTKTMLDTVICSQGITKRVVDLLLDHHSRYGVFTTKEQSNICSVLTRLARSGCSATMTSIVDFQDSLARFCIKHQLYLLAWRCLDHEHIFSETLSHTHPWFRLYLKYRKLPRKLNSSSQLHDAIISACEYLSAGDPQSYLIAHPLVNVAETLSRGAPFIIPLLDTNLDHLPDVTHYQLLQGTALSRLFSWLRRTEEPPHFCQNQLVKKYGYKDSLSFLHYLNQGRPCFAASTYINEQLKTCGKLSSIIRRQASDLAHGLALQNYSDPSVTAACLCFMEILGISSEIARIHIHAANIILHYLNTTGSNQHKNQIGVLLHGLLLDKQQWVPGVLDLLEKALLQEDYPLFYWSLPIKLSRLHNLALPSQLLGQFSQYNNWLKFLIVADLFQFPKQQVLELCEQFRCSKVKQHLLNSLKLRVQTSASVYSYEKIGIGGESCQALGDLLLSLVHCHDSPDPPQSLLSACANLDNPIFTVFAACYEPSSALLCICTWLATTLDQLQPKQQPGYLTAGRMSWSSSQVEGLIVGAVSCGRGLTLARAWSIFMPDHALCLLFNSLVKSFLNNGRWVLKVSISTVNAALIHNFSSLQHRVQFLNALSMAQFPGLDYKLLHQVVVSLLDIDVTVNWASLLEADSSSAIQACVDQLTDKNMFLQATNLCKIVGLSSDSILLAQWSHYFKTHMSGFLKKCDQTFRSAELRPITASRFFLALSQEADSEEERHQLLTLALDWYQRSEEANICERDNLELLTWQSWLRLDTEVQVPSHSELSSVASLLPRLTAEDRKLGGHAACHGATWAKLSGSPSTSRGYLSSPGNQVQRPCGQGCRKRAASGAIALGAVKKGGVNRRLSYPLVCQLSVSTKGVMGLL
uniref:Uncharacterized protein n=1 Tax=Timema monikensis TaxID=170555 RepID=A0A7R9HKB5_9NEOP|nr:unnamed protein product [Timema monikensis]